MFAILDSRPNFRTKLSVLRITICGLTKCVVYRAHCAGSLGQMNYSQKFIGTNKLSFLEH